MQFIFHHYGTLQVAFRLYILSVLVFSVNKVHFCTIRKLKTFNFICFQLKLLLPLANEVYEGYVFTRVCQSFCSQRGSTWAGTPPLAGTPPGRYTPRAGTPPTPPPGAVHAGRYGQQAGGTHPTGMHSCLEIKSLLRILTCFFIWRMGKHFGENSMLMLIDLLWNLCIISEQGGYSNWLTIILLVN